MSIDQEKRDQALRRITGPVAIVGVRQGEELGGLTAAWVTRVSLEPALLLVSIGHTRRTYDLIREARQFTISLVADNQLEAARLFGLQSRREVDKWAQVEYDLLGEGIPVLANCAARFLCEVRDVFTTGDHDCFVGEVVQADQDPGQAALPLRGADYAPKDA